MPMATKILAKSRVENSMLICRFIHPQGKIEETLSINIKSRKRVQILLFLLKSLLTQI
jgi:hypothetical protein